MRLFKLGVVGLICLFVGFFSPAPVHAALQILASNSVPSRSILQVSSDVGSGAASTAFGLAWPCKTWGVVVVRPATGDFDITVQGSLDGITWFTIANVTVTAGVQAHKKAADEPASFIRVLFSDVDTSTITVDVLGLP